MNYPNLVLKNFCQCAVDVIIYEEGLTEAGAPIEHMFNNLKCNYQSGGKTFLTDYQKVVEVYGSCYFQGDPFSDIPEITSGKVKLNGFEREILKGIKARNPDNTVNFVKLELK